MLKLFLNIDLHCAGDVLPAVQVGINGLIEFVIRFEAFVAGLSLGFMKAAVGGEASSP
jgi:hypothetical protein